jgi:predicted ATPase
VAGIPYGQQLVDAIEASRVVLLVFSGNSNESRPVLSELELAAHRGKIILPVRIEDIEPSPSLEFYVRALHWFDAVARPLDGALSELVRAVQALAATSASSATRSPARPFGPPASKVSNLPLQLTSFVGRERDVVEIKKLLHGNRLVTLVASGGAGKTRAALAVGQALLDAFADGVWLSEFAPISDGSLVAATIARALGVRESADRPVLETLVDHCKRRSVLLILDNCEHVIDDVRAVAAALLRNCPDVRMLATSRESLGIAGERVFRLPSLALPPLGETPKPKAALRYGAVALFVDRAVAADGRFILSEENASLVIETCRRLDGIPLAIELAAARIKVLSPQQLAQRLDERFRVLTGGDRSALPRHQTMRAAIDWSYDLLSDAERALFRKLSIFASGFTLEGAAAVCGDEGCDEMAALDMLSSLVDKSLLQTDPGKEDRYRLLESTRQYAREKLVESGDFEASARRHLAYLSALFNKARDNFEITLSVGAVSDLAIVLEDARSALDWAELHDPNSAADLLVATRLWNLLGLNREAIERATRLVAVLGADDSVRLARLWGRIAQLNRGLGRQTSAADAAEQAIRYARAGRDSDTLADTLLTYADVIGHARRFDEAQAALEEAELYAPSPRSKMQVLQVRGIIASISGDLETTARAFTEIHELHASLGNDPGSVSAAINLAEFEHARGATTKAIEIAQSELPRAERLPNRSDWAFLLMNLAGYLDAVDDVSAAQRAACKAIAFYASFEPEGAYNATAIEHLALSFALGGDLRTAALLEGYAAKTLKQLDYERQHTERTTHERLVKMLAANLPENELTELLAHGRRMPAAEALTVTQSAPSAQSPSHKLS